MQYHQEVADFTSATGMVDARFPHKKAAEVIYRSDRETQFQNLADPFVRAGDDPCDDGDDDVGGSNEASEGTQGSQWQRFY